jgi:protein polybromo-1
VECSTNSNLAYNELDNFVLLFRYIENLTTERPAQVSNWENQLYATVDSVPSPDPKKLPTHWLENGVGNHGSELNALWALRDYMMQDALNLSRTNFPN